MKQRWRFAWWLGLVILFGFVRPATAQKLCLTDLRSNWSLADRQRPADLVVCWNAWREKPIPNVRTLVYIEAAAYVAYDGLPYGSPGSFNLELGQWAQATNADRFPIINNQKLGTTWGGGDPRATIQLIDITKRGVGSKFAELLSKHFGWADGIQFNGWTSHGWEYPQVPNEYWEKWDQGLLNTGNAVRWYRPDWIIVGQQFKLFPVALVTNGLYLEQSPHSFGQSFETHIYDKQRFEGIVNWAFPKRESVWIAELRWPYMYVGTQAWYPEKVKIWARDNDFYLSWGRDATAGVGFVGAR